ncbi:hypothetical protein [uncultured Mucilaginibacter sp.]|uniref:hypothetical protein n=1 Tax=uncultured Mucilaginibacter sp. TaxID=797541 RepID=UPI0025FA617B|nr:hypothetical protein [uncultured Mucilaginibacter sp.]
MKRLSIVLAVIGIILLIGGNFIYKQKSNPVDSHGSERHSETLNGEWGTKIPVFAGGVLIALSLVFYFADRSKQPKNVNPH